VEVDSHLLKGSLAASVKSIPYDRIMFSLLLLIVSAHFWTSTYGSPLEALAEENNGQFSVEQVAIKSEKQRTVSEELWRIGSKYGLDLGPDQEEFERQYRPVNRMVAQDEPGKSTVPATSVLHDVQYLIDVRVGNHKLRLDLDTGSSDLWVMSTLLDRAKRGLRTAERLYVPVESKRLKGSTWKTKYGGGDTADGIVFLDSVQIGSLTVPNQAVEAARNVSTSLVRNSMDGLLGMGFTQLNRIAPKRQKTWFDNIRAKLNEPVFVSRLKYHDTGAFDFGFIDKTKYKGDLFYTPVKSNKGYWDMHVSGYAIGNGQRVNLSYTAVVDTGSSLWMVPDTMARAYWAQVPGTKNSGGNFVFPCNAKLPDVKVYIGNKHVVVPGENMNYQKPKGLSGGKCLGGISGMTIKKGATSAKMPFALFGDVFLKSVYTVFEHKPGQSPRLGFASGKF